MLASEIAQIQSAGLQSWLTETVHYEISDLSRLGYTMHCTILVVIQLPDSLDCGLQSFRNQSPSLPVKIVQSFK